MDNFITQICIVGVCGFIGIISFLAGWNSMKKNQAAVGWPTVMGRITTSILETYVTYDENSSGTTMYRPQVTYEYEVEGEVYSSSQVKVGGFSSSNLEGSERKKLAAYPVGGAVEVHYDPFNPQDALLEFNPAKINLGMVIGMISGIVMLYFIFRFVT
jgi:hypothetical protein